MPEMKRDNLKAVVFDLDGTLVNTIGDIAFAMNRVLRDYGYPEHPVEAYKDFVGYGLRKTAGKALPADGRDDATLREAGERLIRYYAERPVATTVPYDGVLPMLRALRRMAVPRTILSNKAHSLVERVVREVLAGFEFTRVLGADNGYPLKPDPASALALAAELGLRPEEVLFIGDSEVDIQTARAAGMVAAAVAWGFRRPEVLTEAGVDILFITPADIVDFFRPDGREGEE